MLKLLLDDFELLYWDIDPSVKQHVLKRTSFFYLLFMFDWLISTLVVGPGEILFWRGVWEGSVLVFDLGLFEGHLLTSNLVALSVGLVTTLCIDLLTPHLENILHPHSPVFPVIARIYSLLWGTFDITLWKGIWESLDAAFPGDIRVPLISLVVALLILVPTKSVRSTVSSPVGIAVDDPSFHIEAPTLLSSSLENSLSYRLLDCLASRVVEVAVVLEWYAVWSLIDHLSKYLEVPALHSALSSMVVGLVLTVCLIFLQMPLLVWRNRVMRSLSKPSSSPFLLMGSMLFSFLCSVASINSYRGLWYLMNLVLLPQNKLVGDVLCSVVSAAVLITTGTVTVLHGGVDRDSLDEGMGLTFYYCTYAYLKKEQTKVGEDKREKIANTVL